MVSSGKPIKNSVRMKVVARGKEPHNARQLLSGFCSVRGASSKQYAESAEHEQRGSASPVERGSAFVLARSLALANGTFSVRLASASKSSSLTERPRKQAVARVT